MEMPHDRWVILVAGSIADQHSPSEGTELVGRRLDRIDAGNRGYFRSDLSILRDERRQRPMLHRQPRRFSRQLCKDVRAQCTMRLESARVIHFDLEKPVGAAGFDRAHRETRRGSGGGERIAQFAEHLAALIGRASDKRFGQREFEIDIFGKALDQTVALEQRCAARKDRHDVRAAQFNQLADCLDDIPILLDERFVDGERAGDASELRLIRRVGE